METIGLGDAVAHRAAPFVVIGKRGPLGGHEGRVTAEVVWTAAGQECRMVYLLSDLVPVHVSNGPRCGLIPGHR
jgi:hypothetical protein